MKIKFIFIIISFFLLAGANSCFTASPNQSFDPTRQELRECQNLPRCGDSYSACAQGEGCFSGLCEMGDVCIKPSIACLKKCGSFNCRILETYPGKIACGSGVR